MAGTPSGVQNPAYRLSVFILNSNVMGKSSSSKRNFTFLNIWNFLTRDMWRAPKHEVNGIKNKLLYLLRTLYIAGRGFVSDKLSVRASALTYTTLLAVVPVVAIVIGIARGFGLQQTIQNELTKIFPGQDQLLLMLFKFVQSTLDVATSGVVLGIGIVFLISSLWTILQSIEIAINDIFQISSPRSVTRKLSDYLATIVIIPVLLILSSGFSVFINTAIAQNKILEFISPFLNFTMTIAPYFVAWLGFTLLYVLIPNTKVKFTSALLAGFIAGFVFQAFQYLYINGQIWVNKYNAIYGTFAAIPLFLLWLQFSWTIVLFGAEIAYAAENVQNFYYEKEISNVSHRYRYFVAILIMNIMCKRFAEGKGAVTMNEITSQYQIPARLTSRTINRLLEMNIISETIGNKKKGLIAYQPAMDINILSVGYLYKRMFEHGSEDFSIDTKVLYKRHWESLQKIENYISEHSDDILIKDL
jgi:membrane protein